MRQGAQGWCTGMTLRDGMGKEVGGRKLEEVSTEIIQNEESIKCSRERERTDSQ